MTKSISNLLYGTLLLCIAITSAGCPSASRTTVAGYTDAMLNNKRISLVIPGASELNVANPDILAASRGVDPSGVREAFHGEFRTQLVDALGQRLDSNTVYGYTEQSISGSVPISAESDITAGAPASWDKFRRAGREGNLDYMLVLNRVTVSNTQSNSGGRGDERLQTSFVLLDLSRQAVVTSGTIDLKVSDPRTPGTTWDRLATELAQKMPFHAREFR